MGAYLGAMLFSASLFSVPLLFLVDRVFSTLYRQNLDRASDQCVTEKHSESLSIKSAQDTEVLFDKLSEVVACAMKEDEKRKHSIAFSVIAALGEKTSGEAQKPEVPALSVNALAVLDRRGKLAMHLLGYCPTLLFLWLICILQSFLDASISLSVPTGIVSYETLMDQRMLSLILYHI